MNLLEINSYPHTPSCIISQSISPQPTIHIPLILSITRAKLPSCLRKWQWSQLNPILFFKNFFENRKLDAIKNKLNGDPRCEENLLTLDETIQALGIVREWLKANIDVLEPLPVSHQLFIEHLQRFKYLPLFASERDPRTFSMKAEKQLEALDLYIEKNLKLFKKTGQNGVLSRVPSIEGFSPALLFPKLTDSVLKVSKEQFTHLAYGFSHKKNLTREQWIHSLEGLATVLSNPMLAETYHQIGKLEEAVPFFLEGRDGQEIVTWKMIERALPLGLLGHLLEEDLKKLQTFSQIIHKEGGFSFIHDQLKRESISLETAHVLISILAYLQECPEDLKAHEFQSPEARALFSLMKKAMEFFPDNSLKGVKPISISNQILLLGKKYEAAEPQLKRLQANSLKFNQDDLLFFMTMLNVNKQDLTNYAQLPCLFVQVLCKVLKFDFVFKDLSMTSPSLNLEDHKKEVDKQKEIRLKIHKILSSVKPRELTEFMRKIKGLLKNQDQLLQLKEEDRLSVEEYEIFKAYAYIANNFSEHFDSLDCQVIQDFEKLMNTFKLKPSIYVNFLSEITHVNFLEKKVKGGLLYFGLNNQGHYFHRPQTDFHPENREYKIKVSKLMPPELIETKKKEFKLTFFKNLKNIAQTKYAYQCDSGRLSMIKRIFFPFSFIPNKPQDVHLKENDTSRKFLCSQFVCESIIQAQSKTCQDLGLASPESLNFFGLYHHQDLQGMIPQRLEHCFTKAGILKKIYSPIFQEC